MLKWKSKGIQHRRLYCNEIIRTSIFAVFLIITTFLNAQTFSHKETTVSESFHKAETFYLLHQWEKAIPIYEEILIKEDSNSAVQYRLACIYEYLGKIQQGLFHIDKALSLHDSNTHYLYQKIRLLEINKQFEEAWVIHQNLISKEQRRPSRYIAAIKNTKERTAVPDMLNLTKLWIEQFGPSSYISKIRFECQKFLGQNQQAENELIQLIRDYPYIQEYQRMLESLNPTESVDIDEKLLQISSSNKSAAELLKWIEAMGDEMFNTFSDSLGYFQIPAELRPEIYKIISESAATRGDLIKANKIVWYTVNEDPSEYESWLFLLTLEAHFKNQLNLKKIKEDIEILFPFYMETPIEIEAIIKLLENKEDDSFWNTLVNSKKLPSLYLIESAIYYAKKHNITLEHKDSWIRDLQNSPQQYHWLIEQIN